MHKAKAPRSFIVYHNLVLTLAVESSLEERRAILLEPLEAAVPSTDTAAKLMLTASCLMAAKVVAQQLPPLLPEQ